MTEPIHVGPDAKQYVDKIHHKLRTAHKTQNATRQERKEPNFGVRDKIWLDSKKHPVELSPKICNLTT